MEIHVIMNRNQSIKELYLSGIFGTYFEATEHRSKSNEDKMPHADTEKGGEKFSVK